MIVGDGYRKLCLPWAMSLGPKHGESIESVLPRLIYRLQCISFPSAADFLEAMRAEDRQMAKKYEQNPQRAAAIPGA